jgi:hypothetical protein
MRRALGLHALEDPTGAERERTLSQPGNLASRHVYNCRVFENRVALLTIVPTGGVCAELGVLHGDFSQHILDVTRPSCLHLIDQARTSVATVTARFAEEIAAGVVRVHHGDSVATLDAMPPASLDWIYIDGAHSYYGVTRDLASARRAVKPDGLIVLNDYVFLGLDLRLYGVIQAVNEFCDEHDYEFVGIGLHPRGNHDVALRRIEAHSP